MADLYEVSSGNSLKVGGQLEDYNPGITTEVDRQIRNMSIVIDHIRVKAGELLRSTGSSNFAMLVSTEHGAETYEDKTDIGGRRYMGSRMRYSANSGWNNGLRGTDKPAPRQRPRAYVFPCNSKGIHEELAHAVLLKAAMGMSGK